MPFYADFSEEAALRLYSVGNFIGEGLTVISSPEEICAFLGSARDLTMTCMSRATEAGFSILNEFNINGTDGSIVMETVELPQPQPEAFDPRAALALAAGALAGGYLLWNSFRSSSRDAENVVETSDTSSPKPR